MCDRGPTSPKMFMNHFPTMATSSHLWAPGRSRPLRSRAYFTNDCAQGSTKVNANAALTTYINGWISRALRLNNLMSV